jgi:phosphate transport system permease protein
MTTIARTTAVPAAPEPKRQSSVRARAYAIDRTMTVVLWVVALVIAALLAAILIYELARGLRYISIPFLTQAGSTSYDGAELYNTFYIIGFALLISVPLGVAGAVYIVEYARQGIFLTILRFATETLAGVPSIVLGLFGFLVFVSKYGNGHVFGFGFSRIAGALTLTILNLPLLLRVSEDALRSVPNELREASVALGSNKVQTVFRVLLPAALASLTTGVILTAGKMIGETAALIYTTGGNSSITGWLSLNPLTAGTTLTVKLYELYNEGVVANAREIEAATAALLILLLLIFNLGLRGLAAVLIRRLSGYR